MSDTAAVAAIGAATRELRLPVVRTDAARLAEIAQRSQQSYLAFLAEVLSAEVARGWDARGCPSRLDGGRAALHHCPVGKDPGRPGMGGARAAARAEKGEAGCVVCCCSLRPSCSYSYLQLLGPTSGWVPAEARRRRRRTSSWLVTTTCRGSSSTGTSHRAA